MSAESAGARFGCVDRIRCRSAAFALPVACESGISVAGIRSISQAKRAAEELVRQRFMLAGDVNAAVARAGNMRDAIAK